MIDRTKVETLSRDLRATIEAWAAKNGLERTGKFNIVFDEHTFRVSSTLEFVELSAKEDVAVMDYAEGLLVVNAKRRAAGLPMVPVHDYGTVFYNGAEKFVCKAVKTRSPKYPFVIEDSTGRGFKVTADYMIANL